MKIAMLGHGMMGVWHSEALAREPGVVLHTAIGRRPEPTAAFAERFGYERWTVSLEEALADPAVDAIVIASPSTMHREHALQAIAAGKHCLVEIPIGMTLEQSKEVTAAASKAGLKVAVCHPMRYRPESIALAERLAAGEERVRMVEGRFFIHRLENIGATGYHRSWTDNILWHHSAHLVDFGIWMLGGELAETSGWMALPDDRTGIPMTTRISGANADGAMMNALLTYHSRERIYETMVVTDRESYRIDIPGHRLITGSGATPVEDEPTVCGHVVRDFIASIRDDRKPRVTPLDVMPCMQALASVQQAWDDLHGARSLPGRPLD